MTAAAPRQGMSSRLAVGASDTWCTPTVVLDRVRRLGEIGLDPCSNPHDSTSARYTLHPDAFVPARRDGLAVPWSGCGLVYVNPPYSEAAVWAAKIAAEAAAGVEVVSLVAARPDARWFFRLCWSTAQAVCFWRGRLRFVGAPNSAPFPSALVYHGERPFRFEEAFHDAGHVVRLR